MLLPLCVGVLMTATLSAQQQQEQQKPPQQSKPKSSSKLITEEDIERAGPSVGNAFEVVELLRPRWFRPREIIGLPGANNDLRMSQVHVYMDNKDRGDLEFLKTIPTELIYTLQYMSVNEVGARFGPASGPGIVVTLKH
jgi:hypothetical protein